ncbi:hypothetical protein [Nostoc commune]|uniref:hypothetical protein n=1 Tax=Nostoc commune TaxID=1178 RepID=UPI0018C588BF|nr:hypothetical protein [Nostoc commune]MBG1262641.1 hypothetical protein [Nostoc commune BAE]
MINNITPTALYKLAAPSTSQAARDEAIDILKAGEVVDPDIAKKLINKYKAAKIGKKQQKKVSSTRQQCDMNKVEVLTLPKVEVSQMEQMANNSMPLSVPPQQDELQKLIGELDMYKAQLKVLRIANEQLQLGASQFGKKMGRRQEYSRLQLANKRGTVHQRWNSRELIMFNKQIKFNDPGR